MHNSFMHSLVQTGIAGTVLFVAAAVLAARLMFKALVNRSRLLPVHSHLVIQTCGILVFFGMRSLTESTGAFFGVDWFLVAPLLLYLQLVNTDSAQKKDVA